MFLGQVTLKCVMLDLILENSLCFIKYIVLSVAFIAKSVAISEK